MLVVLPEVYLPISNASMIDQNLGIEQLGIFVKMFPHDSHLKYITLESSAGVLQHTEVPELYTAIDATVDHLPTLRTIEMRWIMNNPSDVFPQWEADVHAVFSSLMQCGMVCGVCNETSMARKLVCNWLGMTMNVHHWSGTGIVIEL
ncbi:hypothetical protein B0H14DRAFT_2574751 [Mycena olivaceomarginata]|nr:hypothetical protein B0H14DRAFT_2574751 [Mycena olivaceomarginata]